MNFGGYDIDGRVLCATTKYGFCSFNFFKVNDFNSRKKASKVNYVWIISYVYIVAKCIYFRTLSCDSDRYCERFAIKTIIPCNP